MVNMVKEKELFSANQFPANIPILYPLKTPGNLWWKNENTDQKWVKYNVIRTVKLSTSISRVERPIQYLYPLQLNLYTERSTSDHR